MSGEHDEIMREIQGDGHYGSYRSTPLTIEQMQQQSKLRAERWHRGKPKWSLLEWAGAMAGEAGEACNKAKRIKRLDDDMVSLTVEDGVGSGTRHVIADQREKLTIAVAEEACDTILYAICLLNELDVDAEDLLREVFNKKSGEYEFPERI